MNPWLAAALAAQRQDELRRAAEHVRRAPTRLGLCGHLGLRHRVRRSVGWVLVEVGLRLAIEDTADLDRADPRTPQAA